MGLNIPHIYFCMNHFSAYFLCGITVIFLFCRTQFSTYIMCTHAHTQTYTHTYTLMCSHVYSQSPLFYCKKIVDCTLNFDVCLISVYIFVVAKNALNMYDVMHIGVCACA